MRLILCKGKGAVITEGIERNLWMTNKADTGIHRILLVVENDISANLPIGIGSHFGTLVG